MEIRIEKVMLLKRKMEDLCKAADDVRVASKGESSDRAVIGRVLTASRNMYGTKADSEALFVMLYMLQPNVLLGCRMQNGMRKELVKYFPKISPCTISNQLRDLLFYYENYADFRERANTIYSSVRYEES